jgi:multidrug efflux pump subunit AcrA (membrane-fusion protein)
MAGVKQGQRCSIRFYARANQSFFGVVARILPTVSAVHRTLRVLIVLDDATSGARPGMFADVGVGTDKRMAVTIPQSAVVHVGHEDFALALVATNEWRIVRLDLGPNDDHAVEVVRGLTPGQTVLSDGVVLLKPVIADIVHAGDAP